MRAFYRRPIRHEQVSAGFIRGETFRNRGTADAKYLRTKRAFMSIQAIFF